MTHIRVAQSINGDTQEYSTYWNYEPGCVSDITVDHYTLIWTDINGNHSFLDVSGNVSQFTKRVSRNSPDIILLKAGYIVPNDRKFMGYSLASQIMHCRSLMFVIELWSPRMLHTIETHLAVV